MHRNQLQSIKIRVWFQIVGFTPSLTLIYRSKIFVVCSAELLESAKEVIGGIEDGFLEDEASADQCVGSGDVDLYSTEEDEDQAPDARGAGVLYTDKSVDLEDETLRGPEDLEEEAKLSLAIQYSMDSSQSFVYEEEQLQKALMLSKEMNQNEGMDCAMEQLNEAISASLEEAVRAANTIQLHVLATNESNLPQVDKAFTNRVKQGQEVEKLDHCAAGDMTEYDRKCLEAIERKHGVGIQIEGTIINISGFRKFVSQALCDVKLLLSRMSHSGSDQEILKKVQWVFHNPVSSATTPYSPDVIIFLENAWRMKMIKIEVLLDNQPHIINFRDMQEHNTASGESVTISRESINPELMDQHGPGKVFSASDDFNLFEDWFAKTCRYELLIPIILLAWIAEVPNTQMMPILFKNVFATVSDASEQLMGAKSFQKRNP